MAKRNEYKRVAALKSDPQIYRREVPNGAVEVPQLLDMPVAGVSVVVVGRLMLADVTGFVSKLGVYTTLNDEDVIVLENIESDGVSIPAYLIRNDKNVESMNTLIHAGDVLLLEGMKQHDSTSDRHVFVAQNIAVLSKAVGDVYDKNIDFRKRSNMYTHRHVQMVRDHNMICQFKAYSKVYRIIRQYLYAQEYDEMSMTLLQENFEAGLAAPFTTYVVDRERDMCLRLTAELFLRKLMIAGFSKVFEIGKSFRNQGAVATMHPEFTILELYRAYAQEGEMETLLREMLRKVIIEIYGKEIISTDNGDIDCSGEWKTVDFGSEIRRLTGVSYDEGRSVEDNALLLDMLGVARPSVLNKYTVGTELYVHFISTYREPTFLRGLPTATSPLNKQNVDGSTIDETLLVINGMLVADIVNAERDPQVLRARMEEQVAYRENDKITGVNEELLDAMRYGLPPCQGIGVGMERLLMLFFNKKELRDVEVFPVF
jgi:lysyl-tRNA synthetase class 2